MKWFEFVIFGLFCTVGLQAQDAKQDPLPTYGLIVNSYKPLPQGDFTSTASTNKYCRKQAPLDTRLITFRECISISSDYSWKDAFGLVADMFYALSDENDRWAKDNEALREQLRKARKEAGRKAWKAEHLDAKGSPKRQPLR